MRRPMFSPPQSSRFIRSGLEDRYSLPAALCQALLDVMHRSLMVFLSPFFVLVGSLLIISSPLLMVVSGSKSCLKTASFRFSAYIVVPLLGWFMDTTVSWLMMIWWLHDINKTHIAQDSRPVHEDVAIGEPHVYGNRCRREVVRSLQPSITSHSLSLKMRHVLCVHGGGFVAINGTLLMPSLTPLVRQGLTVWCMNYPLSPWVQYPTAVTSVLACLQWMRREKGITKVALLGDSAGGSLVTMAALFASNPSLLSELRGTPGVTSALTSDPLPFVSGVVSLYGILDQHSWRSTNKPSTPTLSRLENSLSSFALDFCVWAYTSSSHPLKNSQFLCDMVSKMKSYPKTMLVVGSQDVLLHSSISADRLLKKHGFDCTLKVYKARHAFVGLPPALYFGDSWRSHSAPATKEIYRFIAGLDL